MSSESVCYLPFGEVRSGDLGELPTDQRFTGHKHEADHLGLIFVQARYYVPELGRFVSPDILIPDPADPQSLNRFSYVNNNPLRYIDPSGRFGEEIHRDLTYSAVYYAVLYYGRIHGLEAEAANTLATDLAGAISEANQAVDRPVGPDSSLRAGTPHWYNHAQAAAAAQIGVDNLDPEEFGRALHAVQDYFSHFGQGFIGEPLVIGQRQYERLLAQDDRAPFAAKEEWGVRSLVWGHFTGIRAKSWDEFNWDDPRCHEMVKETIMWVHSFVRAWFEDQYGTPPHQDWDAWRNHLER